MRNIRVRALVLPCTKAYRIGHHRGQFRVSIMVVVVLGLAALQVSCGGGSSAPSNNGSDMMPPSVTITSPSAGSTVSGTINVQATASDDVAVASVAFQVDGTPIGSPTTSSPYTVSLNTHGLSNGAHTLMAIATDAAGKIAQNSVSVTVANSGSQTVSVSPSSLNFGTQNVGTKSTPETVKLLNNTAGALNVTGINVSGDFKQSNNCGTSVAAGAGCTISVSFAPTSPGTRTGTLTVSWAASQTVSLNGIGANGTTCPASQWCEILPSAASSAGVPDNGWNMILFSHDTGQFYLYANSGQAPTVITFENAFWSYSVQGEPASGNPWAMVSSCGDGSDTQIRGQKLTLASAIGSADKTLTFSVPGTSGLNNSSFPQSGTVWVDDEAIEYSGCTSAGGGGNCQPGSTSLTLSGLVRGVRRAAGYTPASSHAAGVIANLACPAATLGGSASTDHPPTRHPVGATTYDSKRGRIWEAWGYQETWQFQDTWYLCVYQTAYCSAAQIAAGWQRLPLYTSGGFNPAGYAENAMIYDPDVDALIEFGGLHGGTSTSDTYIFCLSANSTWVDSTHTCASSGYVNTWRQITPHGGDPGARDAARMAYDSPSHRILAFGGTSASVPWNSVAIYDPASGDWCLSSATQGGSNASSCNLPALSGPAPPGTKFPMWTFDNTRGNAVLYAGPGSIYKYNTAQNRWTLVSLPGGPSLATLPPGMSWAYDDTHDTFVFVAAGAGVFQTWELPGTAAGP